MRNQLIVSILLSLLLLPSAQADSNTFSNCSSAPQKPRNTDDLAALNRYFEQAEKYARCLTDFINRHGDSIKNHQVNIKSATEKFQRKIYSERNKFYNRYDSKRYRDHLTNMSFAASDLDRAIREQTRQIDQHQEIINQTAQKYRQLFNSF